jgi:succinyl-diaminopimelate desuccinylase
MDPAARLGDLLTDLLGMPCVTGEEGPLADWLERRYRSAGERVRRERQSVVVGETGGAGGVGGGAGDRRPTVLLVGHTDVVPPTDADREPRREADRIVGRGASDMKSGLAVAMDVFEDAALRRGPYEVVLVAYAGEEGAHSGNELGPVLDALPELREAALAVVLEPTDLTVQLGCLGALQAEVTFRGRAAHAARPWHGRNALTAAGAFLTELDVAAPDDVVVDGLTYREVVTPTQAWTGGPSSEGPSRNARNVVPAAFTVNLNYRFAPDKTPEQAEARLAEVVAGRADLDVVDRAPAGRPFRAAPLVEAFVACAGAAVEPKQAWTDVARLSAAGIPALNYGPGLTAQAHQAGEHVPAANLVTARAALARFLSGG